jgi:hypothetical protein
MKKQTAKILALAFLAAAPFFVGCSNGGSNKDTGVLGTGGTIGEDSGSAGGALTDAAQPDAAQPDVAQPDAAQPDVPSPSDTHAQGDINPLGTKDVATDGELTDAAQPDVLSSADRPVQDDANPLATEDARTDSADTSFGDDSATEAPPATIENPQTIPSHQNVIFRVTNRTAASSYLGTVGFYCAAYAIDQGSTSLTMAIGYQCGCECPQPPTPAISQYLVISPEQTKDLVWDARALKTYSTSQNCTYAGAPWGTAAISHGVWQPVGPGSYQVTLTLNSVIPTSCTEANEIVTCQFPAYGGGGSTGGGICPSSATVKASFDLPENGDVIVPITL